MAAAKLDIYIEQGATFSLTVTFRAPPVPPSLTGVPINLTGYTYRGKIRKRLSDTQVIVDLTCTILDQTTNTGQVTFSLTAAQTAAIALKPQKTATRVPEPFAYDIEVVYPNSTVDRVLEGVANISPEVTK